MVAVTGLVEGTRRDKCCCNPGKRVEEPASRISSIWLRSRSADLSTSVSFWPTWRYTGAAGPSKRSRLIDVERSIPSFRDSCLVSSFQIQLMRRTTAQVAAPVEADKDRLVCSTANRSLASARLSFTEADSAHGRSRETLVFLVNSFAKCLSNYIRELTRIPTV